ncbi:MAG: serine/threonine protein kinase, partial [Planctomycetes bacterium]|nr:serine/threonine protein kinase [Planctomycetota bacterium]
MADAPPDQPVEPDDETYATDPISYEQTVTGRPAIEPSGRRTTHGTEIEQTPDRFTLTEVLGEGSQGEVCRAFDNHLQRSVAIKFPHRAADEQGAREILDEARKAARLNHPNVVTIYECGFWKGRPYIAMELVDGVSLATVIKECGRISIERYLRYSSNILSALDAAHTSGLIHRDLKPHNVLVARDGSLKLTDFGVAHVRSSTAGHEMTRQVVVAGTPGYMAPEQWRGERPDGRSDIYAFGCMSYKLLTGRNPFPHEDSMRHHMETPPPPMRTIAPHVPPVIEDIVLRCIAKDPGARFQNARDLAETLARAGRTLSADTAAAGSTQLPVSRGAKKKSLALPLTLLAVVAGLAVFLFVTEPGQELLARFRGQADRSPGGSPGQDPKGITETKGPGDATPPPPDPAAERLRIRREEGLSALEMARAATDPEERMRLAEQAQRLLGRSAPEFAETNSIITAA